MTSTQLFNERKINSQRKHMPGNVYQALQEEGSLPVGQGLKSCIHVAGVSDIFHSCQAYKQEKQEFFCISTSVQTRQFRYTLIFSEQVERRGHHQGLNITASLD